MNSADELLLTELVLDNVFSDYEACEIIALLSCFVFQEKIPSAALTSRLELGKEKIIETAKRLNVIQQESGLQPSVEDPVEALRFGLVEVVYEWARGMVSKLSTIVFQGLSDLQTLLR